MNDSTLITVHAYAGDRHQVEWFMPQWLHHECPVIVMTPDDSRIERVECAPSVITRYAGRRAYIGQDSLDRQLAHMRIALEHPFDFFLMCDSDSFCLSPELPAHLYNEDVLWAGIIEESRPHTSPYPKLAFQPPYFLSRKNLQKMVDVAPRVSAHPLTPFIDWYMVALACEAGVAFKAHQDKEVDHATPSVVISDPWEILYERIKNHGKVMMHPIKSLECATRLVQEREYYVRTHQSL